MSALDVSDPHISMAYDAITQNDPLRWFLLAYGNKSNQLSLCASGTGDLDELRGHVTSGNVYYGIFREPNHMSIHCITISVIPDSVGGVRRARAHVHARTILSTFKTQQVLNASSPEQITVEAVRSALRLPPRDTPMALGPDSERPIDIDSNMTDQSHADFGLTPASPKDSPSSSRLPQFSPGLTAPVSGLSPPSSGSLTPILSNSRSHRKPPPRLSMPPAAKGPPSARAIPGSRTQAEHSPTLIQTQAPSPRSPAATHSMSPPPTSPLSYDLATSSPRNAGFTDVVSPGDLRSQPSWLAKQQAPLPPPPASAAVEPYFELEERPQEPRRAFEPKSAFESDDDGSSEVDHGVRMHGPLTEITGTDMIFPRPPATVPSAYAPASPIGSIPSESSKPASVREPSPVPISSPPSVVHRPSTLTKQDGRKPQVAVSTNGALNGASSAPLTPAQEEAAHALGGWTAREDLADDAEDTSSPPPPPSKPSPVAKDSYKERALHSLGRGVAPNETRRPRAATETVNSLPPALPRDAHRRVASQDTSPSPTASRSRFLERASPETLVEERRLAMLDEERRRRAAERAQREREERAEEEARERAFIERKERERARRIESARQAEVRRADERRREDVVRKEREAKEKKEREAKEAKDREARAKAQERIDRSAGMELLSGFVTLEMASVWRRRYFKLSTDSWQFFRNDKDVTQPVHIIELSHVRALREWNEGYEELEAIPHSFAVELADDTTCQCFADSAEEKEILLGLLNQAAGL